MFGLQAEISNSMYSNVYLKVNPLCLVAIYCDHLMLLPSYPLYLRKVSHINCGLRAAQFHPALIVASPLNALDQIEAKNTTILQEKRMAFSRKPRHSLKKTWTKINMIFVIIKKQHTINTLLAVQIKLNIQSLCHNISSII